MVIDAPRSRGAGIDDETIPFALDERLVRVPVDQNVGRVGRQELCGRRAAQLVSVAHVNREASGLEREFVGQPSVDRIDVAADGLDRRDGPERIEDRATTDISRMQNLRNASQRLK